MMKTDAVRPEVQALSRELVEIRRDLHRHPELAFEEFRTSQLVAERLDRYGLEVQTGVAKTGVVATLKGDRPGRTLLLRADMDALPIEEETGATYASETPGKMHACGHDGHTAILLGAARYLAENKHRLEGQIRFVFQPAEEGPGGAAPMIEEGVLEGVQAAVGLHLWSYLPVGQATVCPGPMMAAADEFTVKVEGVGAHAAQPDLGVDTILVATQMIQQLHTIVARNVSPLESAVLTTTWMKGGKAYNVIPHFAEFGGTVRTFKDEVRSRVKERMKVLLEHTASAYGARVDFNYREGYPPLVNDPQITELVESVCREVLELPPHLPEARTLGGEDMAYYLQQVPGCFFFLGAGHGGNREDFGHHHPKFDINEDSLPLGVELLLRIAERYTRG